ncbi:chromosome segregation protein SMC [Larkinella punicea]|uniref:Chromosome segregation protein SMC n=2 Tax=Larkinella punicea TaxID=2315727 RepID=A0A368JKX9_9BACT|nr:chromosome segregation protein SMC [Larkinella punicea]
MLKRVSIQNFKSLKDVKLNLEKVNLLIGPNNSGKTNFLKALEFFSSYNVMKYPDNWNHTFNKRVEDTIITISTSTTYGELFIKRIYKIIADEVKEETWMDNQPREIDELTDLQKKKLDIEYRSSYIRSNKLKIYTPQPEKIRGAYPILAGNDYIDEFGTNIIPFLELLRDKYRTNYYQIEQDLKRCLPEFDYISFDPVDIGSDHYLRRSFGDKTFKRLGLHNEKSNLSFWADELSEGTLYFLILLCIIHQPNPPKLLLLEEPEKGIHPRRIHEVMNFIFRLADEKDIQIILTTHNENVLNEFTSMPEAVFVFNKDEEGATYVRNLQKDIIEPSHQRSREDGLEEIDFTDDLGKNWMYGLLGGVPTEEL